MSVYNSFSYAAVAAGKCAPQKKGKQQASLIYEAGQSSGLDVSHALKNSSCDPDALQGCYWVERKIKRLGRTKLCKTPVYFNKNGDTYEGAFLGTRTNGQATLVLAKGGGRYEGPFENGKPHGQGEFVFPDKSVYKGIFDRGEMNGCGEIDFPNGDRYIGPVRNGKPHGEGKFYFANKNEYQGCFKNGVAQGKGILFLKGGRCEGTFADWNITEGVVYFANGNRYEGKFENGVPHDDKGRFFYANKNEYQGNVENGILQGRGVLLLENGNRYEGEFKNGLPHDAQGTLYLANGGIYQGTVDRGEMSGSGILYFPDGTKYVGDFKDGAQHGFGTYFTREGLVLDGVWSGGHLTSAGANYLSHPVFLNCLLNKERFPSERGVLAIFSAYFRQKPSYAHFAEDFLSAVYPKSADQIYAELLHDKNPKTQLFSFTSRRHAMLLKISVLGDKFIFQIFNSGEGLPEWHRPVSGRPQHYHTMSLIQVPKTSVNPQVIGTILKRHKNIEDAYNSMLCLKGAKEVELQDSISQKMQQGDDCTMECIFAYLKNILGEKAYHLMRMEFFSDCITAVKGSKNPKAQAFLPQLEMKKKRRMERYAQTKSWKSAVPLSRIFEK